MGTMSIGFKERLYQGVEGENTSITLFRTGDTAALGAGVINLRIAGTTRKKGFAGAKGDFDVLTFPITFDAGATTTTVRVKPSLDGIDEGSEQYSMRLEVKVTPPGMEVKRAYRKSTAALLVANVDSAAEVLIPLPAPPSTGAIVEDAEPDVVAAVVAITPPEVVPVPPAPPAPEPVAVVAPVVVPVVEPTPAPVAAPASVVEPTPAPVAAPAPAPVVEPTPAPVAAPAPAPVVEPVAAPAPVVEPVAAAPAPAPAPEPVVVAPPKPWEPPAEAKLVKCFITTSDLFAYDEALLDVPATNYRAANGAVQTCAALDDASAATRLAFAGASYQFMLWVFKKPLTFKELVVAGNVSKSRTTIPTNLTIGAVKKIGDAAKWIETQKGSNFTMLDFAGIPDITRIQFNTAASGSNAVTFGGILPVADVRFVREAWRDMSYSTFYNLAGEQITMPRTCVVTGEIPYPVSYEYVEETVSDALGKYLKISRK